MDRQNWESWGERNVGPAERVLSAAAGAGLLLSCAARRRGGAAAWIFGGGLLLRGILGRSLLYKALGVRRAGPAREAQRGIKVSEAVTVQRTPQALYAFWRNFENLPRVMRHVEEVKILDEKRSHWKVKGPAGANIEWDAMVVKDIPNELITWQTLEDARVIHAGSVSFRPAAGGGTEVRVILRYDPPAGALGAAVASLLGEEPARQVREDLAEFKRLIESPAGASTAGELQ